MAHSAEQASVQYQQNHGVLQNNHSNKQVGEQEVDQLLASHPEILLEMSLENEYSNARKGGAMPSGGHTLKQEDNNLGHDEQGMHPQGQMLSQNPHLNSSFMDPRDSIHRGMKRKQPSYPPTDLDNIATAAHAHALQLPLPVEHERKRTHLLASSGDDDLNNGTSPYDGSNDGNGMFTLPNGMVSPGGEEGLDGMDNVDNSSGEIMKQAALEKHKMSEKQRRMKNSQCIDALKNLLPVKRRLTKIATLQETIKYVKGLQEQCQQLMLENHLLKQRLKTINGGTG